MTTSMHIIGSRYLGGAEMFFIRLVNALGETGHGITTITRKKSMVSTELKPGIEQSYAGMYNVRDPLSRLQISKIINQKNPDIVQTYMGRATRLTRVPKGKHAIHVSRLGGFYKLDGYGHANAWVGNTRSICDYLTENRFPADRVFLIPNFVDSPPPPNEEDLSGLRKRLDIPEEAFILLGVGRFVDKKGFRYLIEAFSQLPEASSGKPTHLIMVGSGPEEEKLISLASQLNITGRVHWAGWQTNPWPYYDLADILVCPSLHEPLGNVILEAWSHGVPVVSTRTHGALELIEDGVNGILVPCGDSKAISSVINDLIHQPESALKGFSREGKSLLEKKYSKNVIVQSYLQLYDHLLALGK